MALHREVREELGVSVELQFIIGTSHLYRGEVIPENELLGVKYACTITDQESLQMSEEHKAFRWLTANEIYTLLPSTHWLYQTIQRAELMRKTLLADLIDVFRRTGFETS